MSTSSTPSRDACPECDGPINRSPTEHVCTECGVVVTDTPIDHGPDWGRTEAHEPDEKRAKAPNRNLHDRGLGSEMGHASERDKDDQRRVRWNHQAKVSKKDRGRGYATTEIQRMASAFELGDGLTKQAKTLFRQLHERDGAVGRDLDMLAAVSIYATLRIHQRGVTPAEVCEVARGPESRTLARRYTAVCRELGLQAPPPSPEQRVRVVASKCGCTDTAINRAVERVRSLPDADRYSGSPSTLAAAILWDVDSSLTQREVADAAGVTPAGLRNRLQETRKPGQTTTDDWV